MLFKSNEFFDQLNAELEVKKTAMKTTISDAVEIAEGKCNIEYAYFVFLPFFFLAESPQPSQRGW